MKAAGIDGILFDLDGTLADTAEDIALSLNHALKSLGRAPRTRDEVMSFIGDGARALVVRALGDAADEALVGRALGFFLGHYAVHCVDHVRPCPGVDETLSRLTRPALAVVTNKPEIPTRRILSHLGWLSRFGVVLGGDSLPVRKPSPEPLREAARRLGAEPARCLMVGDGPQDVLAGRSAGMKTAAVTTGYRPRAELERAGPDFLLGSFAEVLRIVG